MSLSLAFCHWILIDMVKLADNSLKLRCVHCLNTETPLWRAGPDGPKTLCNACGVRYKKGKLVLYKDNEGNVTAVKRSDSLPVHVPPAPKKPSRKVVTAPCPAASLVKSSSPVSSRRPVRRASSEGSTSFAAVAKKPRSRSRRTNAGQPPGRYASKTLPDSMSLRRSPVTSTRIENESPRMDGMLFQLFHCCNFIRYRWLTVTPIHYG